MSPVLLFSTVLALVLVSSALTPDELFKVCHKKDPKLGECIAQSIEGMRHHFKTGIPELNMVSLDPMLAPDVTMGQGSGALAVDLTITNTKVYGISDNKVHKVIPDLDNYKFAVEASVSTVILIADYSVSGHILMIPIFGQGSFYSNLSDVTCNYVITGSPQIKNDKLHMKVDDVKFDLNMNHAFVHLENLFNGNQELGDLMNKLVNDNWRILFDELKTSIDESVGSVIKDMAGKVFDRFPWDQLLPD